MVGIAIYGAVIALLIGFGAFLRFGLKGYRFSSLICFALAGLLVCFGCLNFLPQPLASFISTVLWVCIGAGVLVVGATEYCILRAAKKAPAKVCTHIIVLGCLVRKDGPSKALQDRIQAAHRYLTDHPHTVAIVSGGQGIDEPRTEAGCMAEALIAMGIDGARIIIEDKATSTWENLRFSLALLPQTCQALGILSSDYHLFRTGLLARRLGIRAELIAAKTTSIPHAIDHFLREAAGVWHYILLGGQYD